MERYIAWLQNHYPEIRSEMTACRHNRGARDVNPYHVEGDCWSHTMMVCKIAQLENVEKTVQIAALLHDIGKPATRTVAETNGHVRFFGHESYSAYRSLGILYRMRDEGMITSDELAEVFALVAMHALPYKTENLRRLFSMFRYNRPRYERLLRLNYCDAVGRFSEKGMLDEERQRRMEKMASNMQETEEKTAGLFTPVLELLVGVSNSGKSTYIEKRKAEGFDGVVISRDALVMTYGGCDTYAACWDALDENTHREIDARLDRDFAQAVKEERSIIVDMTNLGRKSRRRWLSKTPESYHRVATVFLTPLEEIRRRNDAQKPDKHIPSHVIDAMVKRFEYPLYDEVDAIHTVESV